MLETERLILRPPEAQDFEPWCAMMADTQVAQFLGGTAAPDVVWRLIAATRGAWGLFGFSMFSVIERSTGKWVGRLGPWSPVGKPSNQVAWALARGAQGKGYATEGAAAAIDWSFDHLGWGEIIHCIDPGNAPSERLAARLGAHFWSERSLAPPFDGVHVWGQSREAWRARRDGAPRMTA